MSSSEIDRIRTRIFPLREALLEHPLYARIDGLPALRVFLEHHVFAVWDFMSLLKALQARVCCVGVPWTPPAHPSSCRLINAIVLGEESDEDGRGGFASHFDLYRRAMIGCGASTVAIDLLVASVRRGSPIAEALEISGTPEPARRFVEATFAVIDRGEAGALASAFAFGREDLLPVVFRKIVAEIDAGAGGALGEFRYYLDRHIELDGDDHGPMALALVEDLCGDSPESWGAAEAAAVGALESRLALWDAVAAKLGGRRPIAR